MAAGGNNAKIVRNFPYTSRPFLRRQESHGGGRQQCQNPSAIFRIQVDHSCVGRNLIAMGGIAA